MERPTSRSDGGPRVGVSLLDANGHAQPSRPMPARSPSPLEDRLTTPVVALLALVYLALAFVRLDGVWERPSSLLLFPRMEEKGLVLSTADQWMVLATITDNARRILDRPASFRDTGACHPLPSSYTLGEHMWNGGLLAALPLAISGEPVLAYNVMLLLILFASGLAMFAFSFHVTRSVHAAFVAGLFFELYRARVADTVHPYIHANFWTPLALLFLYRLFHRGDWRSALGLAFFGSMQLGESVYPVLAATLLLGTSAVILAIQRRDVLLERLPKLLFCAAVAGAAAWWVLGEYLATAETWNTLRSRTSFGSGPMKFAPGQRYGLLLFGLATLGLLDRVRGSRGPGTDPRIALFVGGLLIFWLAVSHIPLPFSGLHIPSLAGLLRPLIPALSSVRAISASSSGVHLVLCALAGFGVLIVAERFSGRTRWVVTVALVGAILVESFARAPSLRAQTVALPPSDRTLLRSLDGATVLDFPPRDGNLIAHAHYLRLAAEHGGRTAACYNSFASPMGADVAALARRLPAEDAIDALAALGFQVVLVHSDKLRNGPGVGFTADQAELFGGRLEEIGRTQHHAALALDPPGPTLQDWSVLTTSVVRPKSRKNRAFGPVAAVTFHFYNDTDDTFLHPDPVEPSTLFARWFDRSGIERLSTPLTTLLPIAIGPYGVGARTLSIPVPERAGGYVVRLYRAEDPHEPISTERIHVIHPRGVRVVRERNVRGDLSSGHE